jgi:predicted PilT family ATPase
MEDMHGSLGVNRKTTKEIAALIDEIGAMQPEVEAKQKMIKNLQNELVPYTDNMKALTILVSAIEERDPDEIFDQEGALFVATVGRKVTVRTVSDPELAIKLLNKAEKASRGRSSACRSASWTRI